MAPYEPYSCSAHHLHVSSNTCGTVTHFMQYKLEQVTLGIWPQGLNKVRSRCPGQLLFILTSERAPGVDD